MTDFLNLFFPQSCAVCGRNLVSGEKTFCSFCLTDLPRTDFHKNTDNPVVQLFYSNPRIKYATAYFKFRKGSKFQKVIHKLKYNGMPEIGTEMGKYFGAEISDSVFNEVDVLIPVPLHPNRFKKRGYNQSEKIAEGMAVSLNKSVDSESIVRFVDNQTQTKKNQEERRKNVDSIFQIKNAEMLKNKHILIIDDVITTGSTLISLAEEISKIEGTKISIAALGMASN